MFKSFFWSWKWVSIAYGGGTVILALMYFHIQNMWRFATWMNTVGQFMAGGHKLSLEMFIDRFATEGLIMFGIFIAINITSSFLSKLFCWDWYEAVFAYYLPNWNKTLRDINNPAERLQDSAESFTGTCFGFAMSLIRASVVIVTGVPRLWELSSGFSFFQLGNIPGMLVYLVFGISALGTLISVLVGFRLQKCKDELRTARGYLRSGLEHVQRNKNNIESLQNLDVRMKKTRKANLRLFFHQFFFELWLGVYGHFWELVPLVFFGYNVFSGHTSNGHVEQTKSTLSEVKGAASSPISLYNTWTDLRCVMQRLNELEEVINNPENWKEYEKETGWEERRLLPADENEIMKKIHLADKETLAQVLDQLNSMSSR